METLTTESKATHACLCSEYHTALHAGISEPVKQLMIPSKHTKGQAAGKISTVKYLTTSMQDVIILLYDFELDKSSTDGVGREKKEGRGEKIKMT